MRWLDNSTDSVDMSLSKLREMGRKDREACVLQPMALQRARHNLAIEQQQCQIHIYKKTFFCISSSTQTFFISACY